MSRHLLNILTSHNNDADNDDNNTDGENNNGTDNNVYNTNSNNYGGNNNSATPGCSASTAVPAIRRSLQSGMNYENNNNVFVQFSSMLPDPKREQISESNISIPSSHDAVRKPIVVPIVLLQLQKPENRDANDNPKIGTNKNNNAKFGDDDDDEQEQEQNFGSGTNGHQGSVLLIPKMKESRNAMCGSKNVINIHLGEAFNNSDGAKSNKKPESLFSHECGLIRLPHQSGSAHSILTDVAQNQQASPTRVNNDGCCLPPLRTPRPTVLQASAVSNQNNNNNNNNNTNAGDDATLGGEQTNALPLPTIEKSFFHAAFVAPVQPVAGSLLEENSTRVIRKILTKVEKVNTRPLFTGTVEEASLNPKLRVKNGEDKNENDDRTNEKTNNNGDNAKGHRHSNAGNDEKQKRRIRCGVTDSVMNQIFFGKDPRKWMKKNADMLFVASESRVPNSFAHNGKDNNNNDDNIATAEQQQLLTSPRSQHREEQGQFEPAPFRLSLGQRPKVSSSFPFPNNSGINPDSPHVFPSSPTKMATYMNRKDSCLSSKKSTMMKIPLHLEVKQSSRAATCETSTTTGNEESNQNGPNNNNNFTASIPNFFRRFSVRCTLLNPLVHGRSNNSRRNSSVGSRANNNNNNTSSVLPSQSQSRRKKIVSPKIIQVVNNNHNSIKSPSENNDDTSRRQHQPIHKIYLPPQSQDRHQQITGVLSLPGMPLKVMTTTNDFVFRKRFKSIQQVQQYLLHSNNKNNDNRRCEKTVVDILESEFASSGADGKTHCNAFLARASNVRDDALEKELSSIGAVAIVRSAEGDRLKVARSTARNSNSNSINMVPVTSEKRRIPVSDGHTICQNTSSYKCSTQMQQLFSHSNNDNNNNNNHGVKKCNESSNAPSNHKKSVCFVSAEPSAKSNHHNGNNDDDVASDFAESSDLNLSSSYIICDEEDDEILQLKKPSNATVLDVRDANLREAVEVGSASYLTAFLESSPSAFDGAASSLGRYCGTFQPVVQLGKGAYGTAYLVVYKENEKLLQDHQKNNAAPEPVHTVEEFIANDNNNNKNNQNGCSTENQQQRGQASTLNNNGNAGFSLNNFSLVVSGALANNNNTYYANDTSAVRTNNIITDFAALVHRESRPEVQSFNLPSLIGSTSFHALTPRALANFQGCAAFSVAENNINTDDCSKNNNDDVTLIPRVSKRQFGFYNPASAVAAKEIFTLSKSHNPGTNNNDENDNLTVNSTPSATALRLSVSPPRPLSAWKDNNNIFNFQNGPQSPPSPVIPIKKNNNNNKNLPSIFLSPAEQTAVIPRALRKKLLLPTAGPAGGVSGMSATTPVLILDIKNNTTGKVNPTAIRREDLFVCKVEQLPDPELVKRKKKMLTKQQRAPWDSDFDEEEEGSATAVATTNKNGTRQEMTANSPKRMQLIGAVDNEKKQLLAMEANKKRLERMQNEAHILSNIAHPNIVAFVDYYLDKKTNQQLLFLEYVDGGDLQKEIERRSKFQPRRYFSIDSVLHIFVQIVLAVEYLHRHNILHRDIKSQNILISKHCFAKLTDFGTSKQFDQDVDGLVDNKLVGTPLYICPEIVAGKPYSQKSDIWALGVLLIELLSFGFPFDGANFPELRHNIQFRPPLPLRRPGPAVPQEILELAGRLLQKDPDMRPTAKNILTDFACMRGAAVHYDKRVSQLVKSSLSTPVDAAWLTVLRDHFKLIYGHDANVTSQQSRARDSMLRGSFARERSHQNMSSVVPMKMSVVNLTSSQQMKNKASAVRRSDAEEIAVERSATFDSVKSYHYFHTVSPRRRQSKEVPAERGASAGASAANASGANASEMTRLREVREETF